MKIGFDAKRAFHNTSGLGNYSRSSLLLLKKYFPENDYTLYTPTLKKSINFFENDVFEIRLPRTGFSRFFSSYWRSFNLSSFLKKDKIDIFHGLSNELPTDIENANLKSVVTIHDLIFLRFPQFFPKIDNQIYARKFRHACKVADRIIAVSEQTKHDIVNFFQIDPKKISVVYQGCASNFWKKTTEKKKKKVMKKYNLPPSFILNVGTIEPRKNMKNLIYSLLYMKSDVKVVAVGRGVSAYMRNLNKIIKKKNLTDKVIFLHNVPDEDLPAIYQSAGVFAYPSYFEGFGIPILEAMVSKLPVIASSGSCFPETGGDAALYINPNNPEEIAMNIDKVLEDKNLRKKMIKKGLAHAQKFSEENVVTDLMKTYKEVIKIGWKK